ncbi:MAG: MOSC domain-containing protein [Cyclobacteriaceae bacterium]|nr:MOSC domain-containing protein [Cyclobacteriaceae bacterium]
MESTIRIDSVNISKEKGTRKIPVDFIELTNAGISGDLHHGKGHRQVSMLGTERIAAFAEEKNREIGFGDFAENLTVSGMALDQVRVFDTFKNESVTLEITQTGKKCDGKLQVIDNETGDCLMSEEGVYLRVIRGGRLKPGDMLQHLRKIFRIMVITVSDRASAGIYEDKSGPRIRMLCDEFFRKNNREIFLQGEIIPDDRERISGHVKKAATDKFDIIFTTGGTGIGPRDITPEAIRPLLDKEIPGIMEMIRIKYGMEKPNALLSRSIAGVIGTSLIYTLPGSEKAVLEYTEEIFKTINHSMMMLHGIGDH